MSDAKETDGVVGPLAACAEYTVGPLGCDGQHKGHCLSSMSAFVGRLTVDEDDDFRSVVSGVPTDDQRTRILANADLMERMAKALRNAVEWVENGHNGNGREADQKSPDALLTKALKRASRAKPDAGGMCNGNACILGAAQSVEDGLAGAVRLTQALGSLEIKRILKAAYQLEENADDLRAAVVANG